MTRGSLPPQAYTREQLAQAFAWMQTQPEHVRQMAETSDALVALFLKAKRNGEGDILAAPVSEKAFRENLKTLAAEMQQFNSSATAHSGPQMPLPPPPQSVAMGATGPLNPSTQTLAPPPTSSITTPNSRLSLDPRTMEMLIRVQERFNLSSESEALRMLVVLGFEKAQSLFSKEF